VAQATNLSPGAGWIRGDQAIDPKVLQEMERLRMENAELKRSLTDLNSEEIRFPPDLQGPNDGVEFVIVEYNHKSRTKEEINIRTTFGKIFTSLFDDLLTEPEERYLDSVIGNIISKLGGRQKQEGVLSLLRGVKMLRYHLEALGLIKAVGRPRDEGTEIVWTVTEKGRRFAAQAQALYRPKTQQAR
jgi:hypothetical protein